MSHETDPILRALRDGATHIDLKGYYKPLPGEPPQLLSHVVLGSALRNFFITKVKAPLERAIVAAEALKDIVGQLVLSARRIPTISKENTNFVNTHILIDIFDDFFTNHYRNKSKETMLRAGAKVFLFEIEHDIDYRDLYQWWLEEQLKAILKRQWLPREEGHPMSPYWQETKPYGGKYSIISILQDKKRLEALMGDSWVLKEENLYHE